MKSFFRFLTEAKKSKAVQQATRMGLTSDGHGGWYDERGEFVAQTKGDRLEFFNSNQNPEGRDPKQSDRDRTVSGEEPAGGAALSTRTKDTEGATKAQANKGAVAPQVSAQDVNQARDSQAEGPADVPKTKGTLTVAFGRFNPPHIGHSKLMDMAADQSEDGDYLIIPSRTQDKKKSPYDVDSKVELMKELNPDHADRIINDPTNKTIFDILKKAHDEGYANIRILGGDDRADEYDKLSNKYNGTSYQFDNIEVVNTGKRDPKAKGVEGASASAVRDAAAKNDFPAFKKNMPETMSNERAMEVFTQLQKNMGINFEELEGDYKTEQWEVAPKLYPQQLREAYIQEEIYNIGDSIVHNFTGEVGEIVRKGTNHLICVSEDGKMFKTWIQNISPVNYKPQPAKSTPKEREIGTDSLRKFLQRLTPGQ